MQPFALCVALGPLAMYLLLLGIVNLRATPVLVNGAREGAALGLSLSGFVIVGPMQLFMPEAAAAHFGPAVWGLLLGFYGLLIALWALLARPRLVIYNVAAAQLRPILAELAARLDAQASWAGDHLTLPQLGVQLQLEVNSLLRNVTLLSFGGEQSLAGWQHLEQRLRAELHGLTVPRNPPGLTFLAVALAMFAALLHRALENPQALAQGLMQMLRL